LDLFLANVPADDCVFAGDGINDLPVFRRLGRTYCMSHAPVLVRQEAAACADTVCEVLEREMNVQKT
jgi:3-deoxy-D-manno-octulosonate 8-phosphate phosphatase KdsC-like HAD superfamily phosphatase